VLVRRKDSINRRSNAFSNSSGDNSIVSVVDHQRSSVFNKESRFLRKDIEETTVEGRRRGITVHKAMNARENNRSCNVSSGPVDFEGDIVRTNSRVVGFGNNRVDESFGDFRGSTFNNFVVDTKESVRITGGGVNPFILPEVSQQRIDPGRVVCNTVIGVFKGSDRFLARRKRATNGSELV
jgi:hypothetical protein